ncbi:programmed cell death protein 5-like [Oppia nitens]|uniref:programmed cell death protein 5-like n=1 Tax=Oppia nitens TaxID=1686743 RepID=UPI0023D9BD78|nr:programmed cell death protein 5-like [Oppia nitens]
MSDDLDLEAIRAKRLQQLQQQQQQQRSGGKSDETQREAIAERQAKEEEFRNNILSQVLDQSARARLSTLSVAKPEKAKMVENLLIQNTRMGVIRSKLSEDDLIGLLEKVSEQTSKKTTVKFDRRRTALDDSDDEDLE